MELNIKPKTIICKDNLFVLQGINDECIDLVYLDPPFNKNRKFTAPIGSHAEGAEFDDIFSEKDVRDWWIYEIKSENEKLYTYLSGVKQFSHSDNYCYLVYMAIRLIEIRRILKETGSIYLHCDHTMSHYLKIVLDCIFGDKNFISEIVWNYGTPSGGRAAGKKPIKTHEVILAYAKKYSKHKYKVQYLPYSEKYVKNWFRHADERTGEMYRTRKRNGKIVRQYLKDSPGVPLSDVWSDIMQTYGTAGWFPNRKADERTKYPTQKPRKLLERIIEMSTDEGDVVLDPFCGCATTCVAAESVNREWIGVDVSKDAHDLVELRIARELHSEVFEKDENFRVKANFTTNVPTRGKTDDSPKKYVYVISNPNFRGKYKVGIANNAESRLSQYQTADPNRAYKLEYKLLTPHFWEIEKHIHDEFNGDHEWVTGDLAKIIAEIENYKLDK